MSEPVKTKMHMTFGGKIKLTWDKKAPKNAGVKLAEMIYSDDDDTLEISFSAGDEITLEVTEKK